MPSSASMHDEEIITEADATGLATLFSKKVVQHFARHPQARQEGITVKHLRATLEDLIDVRIKEQKAYDRIMAEEPGPTGSRSSKCPPTAYPAVASERASTVTASQVAALDRVDILKDPRCFAVLDEGCNRTCHGKN